MTDRVSLVLLALVLAALAADYALADFSNTLFLARKFLDLTEWMAFWR